MFSPGVSLRLYLPLPWLFVLGETQGLWPKFLICGRRKTKLGLSVFFSLPSLSLPQDILSYLFSLLQFEIPVIAEGN